ncbi:hypothetical protein ACFTZI_36790 [Streptomyces decoyicus]|uniref:hypothetical protein n=1 Tax=Streptomyces decoyicus TaxID=249567 RepID=UPI003636E063
MARNDTALRDLVAAGATFLEVIAYISQRCHHELSPLEFLKVFQEELGISFIESRAMLEHFAPPDAADRRSRADQRAWARPPAAVWLD